MTSDAYGYGTDAFVEFPRSCFSSSTALAELHRPLGDGKETPCGWGGRRVAVQSRNGTPTGLHGTAWVPPKGCAR